MSLPRVLTIWWASGWDLLARLGHPSKFQRASRVGFVTAALLVNGDHPNFARCLAVSWTGTLCIHFWRLLPSDGILPGAEFTLRPSFAFSYIGSVTARHSSKGRQPNQTLWHWEEGATYIRQGGHHVGHRPGSSSEIKWYRFWTTLCSLKPFAQMVSPKRPAGVGQTSVAQLECRVNVWQPLQEVLWQHGVLL